MKDGDILEVNIDDNLHIASVWLTNDDKQNPSVQQQLKTLCDNNAARKYKTTVYLSGSRDLTDCTQSLLLHNRYPKDRDLER